MLESWSFTVTYTFKAWLTLDEFVPGDESFLH